MRRTRRTWQGSPGRTARPSAGIGPRQGNGLRPRRSVELDEGRITPADGVVPSERSDSLPLTRAIDIYSNYLEHEQGASRATRVGYRSWLRRFRRFVVERHGEEPDVSDIGTEDLRAYLYHLSERGLRPRTLRSAFYPLRGLFKLLVDRSLLPQNPALAVTLPKKDAAVRKTVSDDELDRLLSGYEREPDLRRRSMGRALLSVLIYGGLRRQEVLDLLVEDVDLGEERVVVRSGKGAKSRSIYLCADGLAALQGWLRIRPPAEHGYVFLADRRRRLGEEGLVRLMTEAKSLADLRDHSNITPHAIRHATATRLLRNGADLRSIQQFLGHTSLQTTAIYLHTDERQLKRIAGLGAIVTSKPESAGKREGSLQRKRRSVRLSEENRSCSASVGRRLTGLHPMYAARFGRQRSSDR